MTESTTSVEHRSRLEPRALTSGDRLDEIVNQLCEIERSDKLAFALRVGEFVVEHIYGGDLAALRYRGPKDNSFRSLSRHPRLPMRATTLWRYVGIYELVQRFPGVVSSKNFGVSHARALLGLSPAVQEQLIRGCIQGRWTKEQIEERAAARRTPKLKVAAQTIRKQLRRVDRFALRFMDPADLASVSAQDLGDPTSARRTAERLVAFAHALLSRLEPAN